MTTEEMSAVILKLVTQRGGSVSFVEIHQAIGDEFKGEYNWEFAPNVIVWFNMSETVIDALRSLRPKIEPHPAHVLVYMHDGQMPNLPVAKRPTKAGYKKPHWLPVVFNLRPETAQSA